MKHFLQTAGEGRVKKETNLGTQTQRYATMDNRCLLQRAAEEPQTNKSKATHAHKGGPERNTKQ